MADVETVSEGTVISKTLETKVEGDRTVVTEETTVIEVNGDHKDVKDKEVLSDDVDKLSEEKENGETVKDTVSEEKPAEENATAIESSESVPAEQKEQSPPKVILHQFPPSRDVPSKSLFCLKVETFLRLHKIPYENHYGAKPGKKGKLPWIEYQGDRIVDSEFIIEYLNNKFEVNMDSDFSDEQKALGRIIVSTVQEKLYFALLYNRWILNYAEVKKAQRQQQSGITFAISLKMQQSKVAKYLDGQGMGRHTKEEIYQIARNDIKAISTLLGDKEFLLGDQPSSYDCAVFGFFSQCLWNNLDDSLAATFIKENASNIVSYCERMKALCWHDWSDMVLGDKPNPPNLNKRFSFRKKKKASKPKEETEGTSEQKEGDTEEQKKEGQEEAPTAEESKPAEEPKAEETNNKEEPEVETKETNEKVETDTKLEEVQQTEEQTKKAEEAKTNEE